MVFVTSNGSSWGERVRIATDGKVGIGTAGAPTAMLDVNGDIKCTAAIVTGALTAESTTVSGLTSTGNIASTGSLTIGSGTPIVKNISSTFQWNPGTIPNGQSVTTPVTINGVSVGDPVIVGHTKVTSRKLCLYGVVTSSSQVTVTLVNQSGSSVTIPSGGNVRVSVWKY